MSPTAPGKLRLGGMALRNGLLVHGPTHWAAAVRADDGSIRVGSGRKPRVRAADGVPGVRGVARLGEAFAVIPLVKRALPEAKLPFENAGVIGAAAAASLTGALLRRRFGGAGGEVTASVLSLAPAMFALRGGELAAYHGVEHKAIAAYEAPDDRDAADAAKEHDRCGSHLVAPMLAVERRGRARPQARARAAQRARRRRRRRRVDRGRRRGLRVVASATRTAACRARCAGRGSRSSG